MSFKVDPDPTFKASLTLISFGEELKLNVTFKHMSRKAFLAILGGIDVAKDKAEAETEALLKIIKDWDIDLALTKNAVGKLCDERPGIGMAILMGYQRAFMTSLKGN